jgi:hypothetical protein
MNDLNLAELLMIFVDLFQFEQPYNHKLLHLSEKVFLRIFKDLNSVIRPNNITDRFQTVQNQPLLIVIVQISWWHMTRR